MNVKSAFRTNYSNQEHLLMIQASFWFKEHMIAYVEREKRFNGNARDLIWSQFIEMYSTCFPKEAAELNEMYDDAVIEDREDKFIWSLYDQFQEVEINPIQND